MAEDPAALPGWQQVNKCGLELSEGGQVFLISPEGSGPGRSRVVMDTKGVEEKEKKNSTPW